MRRLCLLVRGGEAIHVDMAFPCFRLGQPPAGAELFGGYGGKAAVPVLLSPIG
jgi:hypothetical protein